METRFLARPRRMRRPALVLARKIWQPLRIKEFQA
jgi:hypothetical protein